MVLGKLAVHMSRTVNWYYLVQKSVQMINCFNGRHNILKLLWKTIDKTSTGNNHKTDKWHRMKSNGNSVAKKTNRVKRQNIELKKSLLAISMTEV